MTPSKTELSPDIEVEETPALPDKELKASPEAIGDSSCDPIHEAELRTLATCVCCGLKIGETGVPIFWKLTGERHGIKLDAVRRSSGLALMLGNCNLAAAMGPDEAMTVPLARQVISVCDACLITRLPELLISD